MRYKILAGVMLVGAGCGAWPLLSPSSRPAGDPTLKALSPVPTARPNDMSIAGPYFDQFLYFPGSLNDGGIPCDPGENGSCTIHGMLRDGGSEDVEVRSVAPDTCALNSVPPLYAVRANNGLADPCEGEKYSATIEESSERCDAGTLGHMLDDRAMAVPGYWDSNDMYHKDHDGRPVFTLSCSSGVAAKCVHWGYPPLDSYTPDGGASTPLLPYYTTCVLAARAAYIADQPEKAFTCNGIVIDVYDRLGVQTKNSMPNRDLSFESAWTASRLACLHTPRFAKCDQELKAGNVPWDPATCLDPADAGWDSDVGPVLLGILSSQQTPVKCDRGSGCCVIDSKIDHCPHLVGGDP